VPIDETVITIRRLLSVGGEPVAYHREYLVFDPARPIVEAEMGITTLQGLFDGRGQTVLKRGDLGIETTTLTEEESKLLLAAAGSAAFRIEHAFFDFDDRPVSWGWFIVRGDRLRFTATVGSQGPTGPGGQAV
ncbi:MAG: UTRA domain-containing protein, partial [Nitrososphaerales archaeon]